MTAETDHTANRAAPDIGPATRDDECASMDEIMRLTGIKSTQGVYRALRLGRLPGFRIGRNVRIRRATLLQWIEQQERRAAA